MIAELYAPTRGRGVVLQLRDEHGERWIGLQVGTPVVYEDLAGMAPGCEPERIAAVVERVEMHLTSPRPKLLVFLRAGASCDACLGDLSVVACSACGRGRHT